VFSQSHGFDNGTWHHFALVRDSGTTKMYVDGTDLGGSYSDSNNYVAPNFYIASRYTSATYFTGNLSNFRVVKGTALYTSNFTPSTTPLTDVSGTSLLTCNANRFIDTSSNAHTITVNGDPEIKGFSPFADTDTVTGSGVFKSGNYLSAATDATFGLGTGDFTYEAWVYPNSAYTTYNYIGCNNTSGGFVFYVTGGQLKVRQFAVGDILGSSTIPELNRWTHVATTREGTTLRIFVNGELTATATNSTNFAQSSFLVGNDGSNLAPWLGYISNARLIKGTAVYTSAFTPPTSPLTAVSGTSLLTLQNRGANRNIGFIDSSHPTRQITRNGNVTQGSFSPFSQDEGKWGNYFDGSSLLYATTSSSIAITGSTDFCIEAWVYPTNLSAAACGILQAGQPDGSLTFRHNTDGTLRVLENNGATQLDTNSSLTEHEWQHVAATRSGSTLRIFINGVEDVSTTSSVNYTDISSSGQLLIGGRRQATYFGQISGYMSNVRFVVGDAVYTSNFTPSTTPLTDVTNTELLTCQSNRFVDNSSNAHSITVNGDPEVAPFSPFAPSTAYDPATKGGSGYFDGSGDTLNTPSDADFNLSSGDWTIEGWTYGITDNANERMFSLEGSSVSYGLIRPSTGTGQLQWNHFGTAALITSSSGTAPANEWVHFALVSNSGTITLYVNGTSAGTTTTYPENSNTQLTIAGSLLRYVNTSTNAYMSDFRVVKGTAVYTSAFTPPTAPLTKTDSTSLLCNFTNAGIYDGTGRNVLETVGDAHVENSVKKYGTGSMQFDGTGDYLSGEVTSLTDFGSGDFTIECWLNLSTINQFNHIVLFGRDLNSGLTCDVSSSNNPRIIAHIGGSWSAVVSGSTTLSADTWYHLAYVRNGSSFKIYVNGVEDGSATNSNAITDPSSDANAVMQVAYFRTAAGADRYLHGYIDDLRITKGVARYTANFTPPAAVLPKQ